LMNIDLILLTGCSSRGGWERAAHGAWDICRDTPVVALGSNASQDSVVSALVGASEPAFDCLPDSFGDAGRETISFGGFACSFKRLVLTPTLTLFEPRASTVGAGVGRALEYIEAHFAEPLTLTDVALVAAYSRCHFSKVFKEQT